MASIRTRLTLSHLVVILVAMGLSGLLLLSLMERYFLAAMEDSLAAQARITAQALVPGALAGMQEDEVPSSAFNTVQQRSSNISLQAQNVDPPAAQNSLAGLDLETLADASIQLSSQLETRIRLLDARGALRVDSRPGEPVLDPDEPLVAQALAGQTASRVDRDGPQPVMHLAQPVVVEGRLAGVVYLSQPLRDALAVVRDLRSRWLLATAVALALSAAVGLLLSGAMARPLRRLTAAAGAVADGRLDLQIPAGGRDELGRLSRAFNEMTGRLRIARQVQVDFVANVSHELRTPLTAIKGTVETLRDGAVDDVEARDRFLETVEGETDRLIRLVNDLLLLSRTDSQALALRPRPVDVAQLAFAAGEHLAPQASARRLTLDVQAEPHVPLALADPDRVQQILVNLLDNAYKYSPPGSRVTIFIDAPNSDSPTHNPAGCATTPDLPAHAVQIQVRDEGVGIPAQDLPRIGERFYRADRARSRAEGGSGLGLAIAQALVQAQGGRLWLESTEGQGTTVTFTLPAALPDR